MIIAFDTNVVLDFILERGNYDTASALIQCVVDEEISGFVSSNSITDVYYVTRRATDDQTAREAVMDVISLFDVAPVDGDTCAMALNTPMGDYEDAVLAVCAARAGADYIATSDQGFLRAESPVPAKTPGELLQIIAQK